VTDTLLYAAVDDDKAVALAALQLAAEEHPALDSAEGDPTTLFSDK
jgi:hypothetical protein